MLKDLDTRTTATKILNALNKRTDIYYCGLSDSEVVGIIQKELEKNMIETILESAIEKVFYDVNRLYDLKSGDFTPEQDMDLDKIQKDLLKLLHQYVKQNKEYENL